MKTIAVIQARMSSTRLPGKVMLDLAGKTVLNRVVSRVSQIHGIDEIIIATSSQAVDEIIVRSARKMGVKVHRGSLEDVLSRYYEVAVNEKADLIMRITSDCPLLDPVQSGKVLQRIGEHDYASNFLKRTLPRGLDTEVFTFDALERTFKEAHEQVFREHVTPFIYNNPSLFKVCSVYEESADYSHYRWTLDTLDDYLLLHKIYEHLDSEFGYEDVLAIMKRHPEWVKINEHVEQKK
jgi:spore coat polysaccharide biosynthesis protein SpsF